MQLVETLASRDANGGSSVPRPELMQGAPRNSRLQHLRGLGALLVLLFHAGTYLSRLRGDPEFTSAFPPFLGVYGVAVFFVLSGYLMAGLSQRAGAARFLIDRIIRIYPLFLTVVCLAALSLWASGFPRTVDPVALVLAPAGARDYLLGVEWTLLFEMTYYVIIALAILIGAASWLRTIFSVWLAVLAVLFFLPGSTVEQTLTPTLTTLFGQTANGAFLIGFLMRSWIPAEPRAHAPVLATGAALLAVAALACPEIYHRWLAAVSSALLVAAALRAKPPRHGVFNLVGLGLGDASYALYLCHVPLILLSHQLLPMTLAPREVMGIWLGGALALAFALTPLDLSLHRYIKAKVNSGSPRAISVVACGFGLIFGGVAAYQDYRQSTFAVNAQRALFLLKHATMSEPIPTLLAGIDSVNVLPDGRLIVRGYAIDTAAPDDVAHIALEQAGALVGFDRMTRMRPREARAAGRADLAKVRFGFGVVTTDPLDCSRGPVTAKIILSSGTVVPLATPLLAEHCPTRREDKK